MALQASKGEIIYVTDCEGVYLNYHNGHPQHPAGEDADLWHCVGKQLRDRPTDVAVLLVRSHQTAEDV
eukprot:4828633-Pyramimonas_sp.AAC.1